MFKQKKFNFKHNFDLEVDNLSKNIQKSKFIAYKRFYSVIGLEDFYSIYYLLKELKKYLSFENKKILDIGCGNGRFLILCTLIEKPLYCVGLDPAEGLGSEKNIIQSFRDNIETLNIKNIEVMRKDIWDFDPKDLKFDIIIAQNALHHIIETSENLLNSDLQKEKHRKLFLKIFNSLEDNGVFIIKEASKYNLARYWPFYGRLLKTSQINWKTKHSPREYIRILRESEFQINVKRFKVPYNLDKMRRFLSNPLASFFFNSTYFIIASKS